MHSFQTEKALALYIQSAVAALLQSLLMLSLSLTLTSVFDMSCGLKQ